MFLSIFYLLLSATSYALCFHPSSSTFSSLEPTERNEGGKTWNKLSNLYMFYHSVEKLQKYEELLNQYRAYLINFISENNDICMLHEYMTDKANDIWAASSDVIENQAAAAHNRIRRSQETMEPSLREDSNKHPSALDAFFEIAAFVRDRLFYLKLLDKLEEQCADPRDTFLKRDGTRVIGKKQKFHSWGGKRSDPAKNIVNDPVVSGMRRSPNPPFHSWGGK